jgi:hypothetical protein
VFIVYVFGSSNSLNIQKVPQKRQWAHRNYLNYASLHSYKMKKSYDSNPGIPHFQTYTFLCPPLSPHCLRLAVLTLGGTCPWFIHLCPEYVQLSLKSQAFCVF